MLRWRLVFILFLFAAICRAEAPVGREGWVYYHPPKPLPKGAVVEDWATFLGPRHDSTCSETHLLQSLPKEGPPLVWEITRGSGYSSPAVADGRVIVFHRVGDEEVTECLEAETGKSLWKFAYPTDYQDRYGYCDGPRCMPVIGNGQVFTCGAAGVLQSLDLKTGQLLWRRDLMKEYKLEQNFFGVGSTPLIESGLLIVNVGADGGPCVIGLDLKTGKTVWNAGKQWGSSYASPIPANIHGQRRVFVFAGGESRPATGGLMCIDPADGAVDFEFSWRGPRYESVNASSPAIIGNRVLISECYGMGGILLELDDKLSPKEIWRDPTFGTHFMTAVYKDGYFYGCDGHGPLDCPLVCVEAATGKEMWRAEPGWNEVVKGPRGERKLRLGINRGQLVLADGKCVCLTENGNLLYLDLNPKGYKELSRTLLFVAGESWSQPVISHGLLYINQNSRDIVQNKGTRLLCYDLRGE